MIPYRDENETQRTAYITIAIIVLNVVVWLFIEGAGMTRPMGTAICNYGLIPAELTETRPAGTPAFPVDRELACVTDPGRQPMNLLTSMFMHGGWMHLIGNMWFFWLFGNNIEDSMGHLRFIVFYLLCGLVAALLQVLFSPTSLIPMVGASGAISGVMGAYLILYPRVKVYAILPLFIFWTTVALPAWVMLGYWMVVQFFGGLQSFSSKGGGVAFWAHVGGFVAGVVLIRIFARPDYIEAHRGNWRPQRVGW
jgi:membrane associated rhomboid family serine protease